MGLDGKNTEFFGPAFPAHPACPVQRFAADCLDRARHATLELLTGAPSSGLVLFFLRLTYTFEQ